MLRVKYSSLCQNISSKMKLVIVTFIVLNDLFGIVFAFGTSKIVLYLKNENKSITLSGEQCGGGAVFDNLEISCACMTGLWAFFQQDCGSAHVIFGATSGQCVSLNLQVHKISLISPTEETSSSASVVVLDERVSSIGGKFMTEKGIPPTVYFVSSGFPVFVTTGQQSWRLPHKNLCMKPYSLDSSVTNYCLFKHSISEEYWLTDEDCYNEDEIISPLVCTPYLRDKDTGFHSCADAEVVSRRARREADAPAMLQMGLNAVQSLNLQGRSVYGNDTDILEADENEGLNVTIDRPIINSEIWNFMTFRAQVRLGIREPKLWDKSSLAYSPAFEFLEMAKQIQQKACPDHYVSDEHYDISIGAFESLQKNHLRYMDSFLDFSTSERIMDALNDCLNNITEYPFVERIGKTGVSCNGSIPIMHGSYEMYDQILELTLGHDQGSRANEPIVETVWKVFIHAHSACFPHFKKSFNDHHRFATIMLSLFTNEVNDMWFSVTDVKPDIYSGFLGDAVDLMDSVAYCAMFSRLDSTYPWDLPRPKKDNARKKRQVSDGHSSFECMDDYDARNVCPLPEDSLLGSDNEYDDSPFMDLLNNNS